MMLSKVMFDYIDGNGIKVKDLNHAVELVKNIDNMKKENWKTGIGHRHVNGFRKVVRY